MRISGYQINIEKGESGLLFATSPDLKGLLVAANSRKELLDEIPEVIKLLENAKKRIKFYG